MINFQPIFLLILSFFPIGQDDPTRILFFGDSLTAGYGLSKEQAFPALVAENLEKRNESYQITNGGVSGETSAGGKSRIDWVLKSKVDIFILELGANDGLRGLPLTQTRENLQSIIDKVKSTYPDVKIIIAGMQVPPNLGEEYAAGFRKIFPELARKNDAVLIPFLLEDVAGKKELNLPDGIHPNPEGHKIVAGNVIEALNKIIPVQTPE